jgi:hypothetical protein
MPWCEANNCKIAPGPEASRDCEASAAAENGEASGATEKKPGDAKYDKYFKARGGIYRSFLGALKTAKKKDEEYAVTVAQLTGAFMGEEEWRNSIP